ncbi:hypothetical protein IMZ48_37535 [Candidatus Bathyarchaeota archaeon]|nr:hypothetical protein [Candidatus Bathyarchaeota archaeon]
MPAATTTARHINHRASLPGAPRPLCQSPSDPPTHDDTMDTMSKHAHVHSEQPTLPPALPRRSTLRASMLLDSMPLKLQDADQPSLARAPHELYLSSEEDASSSAGDFSEYGDEDDEEAEGAARKSYEDVARAVPVVFAGKPTVVTVRPRPRRSSTMPLPFSFPRADKHLSAMPLPRADKRSSTMPLSPADKRSSAMPLPRPRADTAEAPKRQNTQPAFLDTDPFHEPRESMLKRTMGLVRKRSKPFLNMSMANASQPALGSNAGNFSTASLVSQSPSSVSQSPVAEQEPRPRRGRAPSMPPVNPDGAPVTYQDIMRSVRKNESRSSVVGSPVLVPERRGILGGLGLGKRKSVRAG